MPKTKMKAKRRPRPRRALPDRLPIAAFKAQLSRCLREVQVGGQAITITMHGRDVAVISPPKAAALEHVPLKIRPRLDQRPLSELIKGLKPLPGGEQVSEESVRRALDETREDRL